MNFKITITDLKRNFTIYENVYCVGNKEGYLSNCITKSITEAKKLGVNNYFNVTVREINN